MLTFQCHCHAAFLLEHQRYFRNLPATVYVAALTGKFLKRASGKFCCIFFFPPFFLPGNRTNEKPLVPGGPMLREALFSTFQCLCFIHSRFGHIRCQTVRQHCFKTHIFFSLGGQPLVACCFSTSCENFSSPKFCTFGDDTLRNFPAEGIKLL